MFAFSHISPTPFLSLHLPPFGPVKVDSDRSLLLIDDYKVKLIPPCLLISISLCSVSTLVRINRIKCCNPNQQLHPRVFLGGRGNVFVLLFLFVFCFPLGLSRGVYSAER